MAAVAPYDPVDKAREVARIVCDGALRKYHRFRPARFYGGIATADCVGCCLGCIFCWAWEQVVRPEAHGRFYSPEEVAQRLVGIARKHGFLQMRISGNEPTIGRSHLLEVAGLVPEDIRFVLETNGILIGHDPSFAEDLARFPNLHVRVSLKGATEDEFARLTGARPEAFELQLQALANLDRAGASVHVAVMTSFSPPESVEKLRARLARIAPRFAEFEDEELVLYGHVTERLKRAGITYRSARRPG
ncbi:MAG: radical SAM protein [Pseudomonadota bacterium]